MGRARPLQPAGRQQRPIDRPAELETKKSPWFSPRALQRLAERTGLEPATSGVTGQHSNQLNYRSALETLQALILSEDIQIAHPEMLLFSRFF
jgi:hypothetical protein